MYLYISYKFNSIKPVLSINKLNEIVNEFVSLKECSEYFKLSRATIRNYINTSKLINNLYLKYK